MNKIDKIQYHNVLKEFEKLGWIIHEENKQILKLIDDNNNVLFFYKSSKKFSIYEDEESILYLDSEVMKLIFDLMKIWRWF